MRDQDWNWRRWLVSKQNGDVDVVWGTSHTKPQVDSCRLLGGESVVAAAREDRTVEQAGGGVPQVSVQLVDESQLEWKIVRH